MVRRSATSRPRSDARKGRKHTSATEKKDATATEEGKREEGAGALYAAREM
jgi:hypothetical protein